VYETLSCDVLQARVEELSRVEHALRADLSSKEQETQRLQQQVGEGARVEFALRNCIP
jgi:prefoldin subunit 5